MTRIPALPQDQVRELEQELVAEVLAELHATIDAVAGQLGEVVVAATMPGPGGPWVSETDLAAIPSLWTRVVDGILTPIVRGIWQVGAGWIVAHLSTPAAIADSVVDDYLQNAANRLKGIGQVLWEQARDGLREGIALGETVPQLRERVRRAAEVSTPRAEVIARTEALRAHNAASQAQMEALGDPSVVKEWLATNDLRTRPTHRAADGQTVGIFESFEVGEARLMQPGDPTGAPRETVQCRCAIAYDVPDEVLVAADWNPTEHPRNIGGQFARTPGGTVRSAPKLLKQKYRVPGRFTDASKRYPGLRIEDPKQRAVLLWSSSYSDMIALRHVMRNKIEGKPSFADRPESKIDWDQFPDVTNAKGDKVLFGGEDWRVELDAAADQMNDIIDLEAPSVPRLFRGMSVDDPSTFAVGTRFDHDALSWSGDSNIAWKYARGEGVEGWRPKAHEVIMVGHNISAAHVSPYNRAGVTEGDDEYVSRGPYIVTKVEHRETIDGDPYIVAIVEESWE